MGSKKRLGEILVKEKVISAHDLERLLKEQSIHPQRLASKALEMELSSEINLLKALSEQSGLPCINLNAIIVSLSNLDLVPQEIAVKYNILPILIKEDQIFVAIADPEDRRVIDELEFITKKKVFPYLTLHSMLSKVIDKCYSLKEKGEKYFKGENVPVEYLKMLETKEESLQAQAIVVEDKIQNAVSQEKDIKLEEISEAFEIPPPPPPVSKDLKEKKQILKKILVVDDDDDIRKLITKVLKQQKKYTVITASEGQTALQIIRSNPPDMIILDAMLPEVHGFEICKKIKQSSKYTHIPVIMITAIYKGWRFAKDLKESYKVDDFIEKPFRISDLISRVEKIFAKETKPQEQEEKLATEIEEKLRQGIKRYRQGDIQGAINFLQEGIKIDPLAYNLHYHLGLLYGKEGKIYKAIQELEIATKLVPHHFRSLKNLAILYQKAGFRYKAIEMWEQALGNSPDKKTRESIKKHLINLL